MIHIPIEASHDAAISGLVLITSFVISVVFKQSKYISILIARVLVDIGIRALNFIISRHKNHKEHKEHMAKLLSDWHILKSRLKGDTIGIG